MNLFRNRVLPLLFAISLMGAVLALSGCGGGGSEPSRVAKLVGKVYSKVIGGKIGVIKGTIKEISDSLAEIDATFEVDGVAYAFKAPVDASGAFSAGFVANVGTSNTVAASGEIFGTVVQNTASAPEPQSIIGTWRADLPNPGGTPGQTTRYTGTLVQSDSNTNASAGGGGASGGTTARLTTPVTADGQSCQVTIDARATDAIPNICGKTVYFAGSSTTNFRTFSCTGTSTFSGTFRDDTAAPGNSGTFRWGYVLSSTDKSKLDIRPLKDFGYAGLDSYGLATSTRSFVQICYQFTSGNASPNGTMGVLGEFNGVQQLLSKNGSLWQSKW